MTLRHQGAMGTRETRTQEALVAALRARPRTPYRAVQCLLVAKASIFNSLLGPLSDPSCKVGQAGVKERPKETERTRH